MKNFKARVCQIVKDKKGNSELVAVIILIIIVLMIGAVVFFPGLNKYISSTVLPKLDEITKQLFDFKGN